MQLTGYYSHAPNDLTTFGNQPLDGDTFIRALLPDIQLATKPNTSSLNIVPVNRLPTWGFNFKVTADLGRSEEHTSELQSLMRISYAVTCLQKRTLTNHKMAAPTFDHNTTTRPTPLTKAPPPTTT